MKKLLAVILVAMALSACQSKPPVIVNPVNDFIIVHPDPIEPVTMRKIDWEVWNKARVVSEANSSTNGDKVYYVLSESQFSDLMNNLIDISGVMKKYKMSNDYYKKSIDSYNETKKAK